MLFNTELQRKVDFFRREIIMVGKDDMKSCIQEWMAQALNIEDLAKIYATIVSETDRQLSYMCQQFEQDE